MKQLVERGMQAGAWGLSTGLIYVPGRYARTAELIELAKVARRHGGIYASHIRSEGAGLLESIDEAIAIGKGAERPGAHLAPEGQRQGVLGHGPPGPRADRRGAGGRPGRHGRPVSLHRLEHPAGGDGGPALGHPGRTPTSFARLAADPVRGPSCAARSSASWTSATAAPRSGSRGTRRAPSGPGSTWPRSPREAGTTPLEVVLEIQRHGGAQAISFGMSEDDVREVMRHEFVATASDGSTHLPGRGDQPHPRAYGTFPRKIRYALDDKVITLEQAIRSCSGWPAEILGLPDRGRHPRGRHRRHRRLRPGDVPRRGHVRPADPVRARRASICSSTAWPLIADGRLTVDAEPEREAARPGAPAATGRSGRADRQGGADLDRRPRPPLGRGPGRPRRRDRRRRHRRRRSCASAARRPA